MNQQEKIRESRPPRYGSYLQLIEGGFSNIWNRKNIAEA
jgi:hypothetical protein